MQIIHVQVNCHIPKCPKSTVCTSAKVASTRMHSCRMRTVRSSSRLPGDVCLGVCLPRGCVCPEDMSAWGVCICPRGLCLPRGEGCFCRHPPVDRMTDACENITLPQRSCDKNVPLLVKYDEFLLYTDIFVEINMKFRVSISYLHGHLKIIHKNLNIAWNSEAYWLIGMTIISENFTNVTLSSNENK